MHPSDYRAHAALAHAANTRAINARRAYVVALDARRAMQARAQSRRAGFARIVDRLCFAAAVAGLAALSLAALAA